MKEFPVVPTYKFLASAFAILKNPLPFHKRNFLEKGDTFILKLGFGNQVVFSRNARLAQYVLQKNQKNYTKSPIQTEDLSKYVGKGLLTAEGKHWAGQRKLIQPAFHKKQLENLLHTMQKVIKDQLRAIKAHEDFDVFPVYNDLAFQTVSHALFSGAANQKDIDKLQQITEQAQAMLVKELRQPYLGWWFKISGKLGKSLAQTQEARRILKGLILKRQASDTSYGDLLDMLLEARYDDQSAMPMEQLIDEILILFIAGHETTANALTFTTQLLAKHPEIQEAVYLEALQFANEDLASRIKKLQYTNKVIHEAMRLYPPAYFIDRTAITADNFEGYHIASNTSLLFSLYEIHRHSDFWENPDTFSPARFDNPELMRYTPYFLPFGAGSRKCIGTNFAIFEMLLVISELVLQYRMEALSDEIEILPLITLKPKHARVQFIPRNR